MFYLKKKNDNFDCWMYVLYWYFLDDRPVPVGRGAVRGNRVLEYTEYFRQPKPMSVESGKQGMGLKVLFNIYYVLYLGLRNPCMARSDTNLI